MKRKVSVLVLPVLAAMLLAPAGAGAVLPPLPVFHKAPKVIVPTQLAGVRLGMTTAAVRQLLSDPGNCPQDAYASCTWGDVESTGQLLVSTAAAGRVEAVSLSSRYAHGPTYHYYYIPSVAPPLTRIKTREGIGIGSPLKRVVRKYPGGDRGAANENELITYTLHNKNSALDFVALRKSRKIVEIHLKRSHVD